jgi:hypothetical protein
MLKLIISTADLFGNNIRKQGRPEAYNEGDDSERLLMMI